MKHRKSSLAKFIFLPTVIVCLFLHIKIARATSIDEVLLIVNDDSPYSIDIADYYQLKRGIPESNICHINSPVTETVTRNDYNTFVRNPINSYLDSYGLSDNIYYILTTKGVPLRIKEQYTDDDGDKDGPDYPYNIFDRASVDSELTLLDYLYDDLDDICGHEDNPYYAQNESFKDFRDRTGEKLYLVGRLTGYETDSNEDDLPDDVKALIDRAQGPSVPGVFILDEDPTRTGLLEYGNNWMDEADEILTNQGAITYHDETETFVNNQSDILGYCSWGSNDINSPSSPYYSSSTPGNWANGALTTTYVSSSARSFNTGTYYGQSLIADLIHLGASGAQGHVYEPYLGSCARPQILFPRYFAGYEMLESYYMATPWLSWQEVNVGDPLMVIPEPRTILLLAAGLFSMAGFKKLF